MGSVIFIPKVSANTEKVEVGKIRVKKGDYVKKGDVIMEIVTEKATFDIEADSDGQVLELICSEGDELNVLDEIGYIGGEKEITPVLNNKRVVITNTQEESNHNLKNRIMATPIARKVASENNINLEKEFEGYNQVIKEEDVINLINKSHNSSNICSSSSKIISERINAVKKLEISNLTKSKEMIYSSVLVSLSSFDLNNKVADYSNNLSIRLSSSELIFYSAARLLKKYPKLNAFYYEGSINLYDRVNLGIAVSINDNLLVPVIRDADKLEITEFSSTFKNVIMNSVKNKLEPRDFTDVTFTTTDLSSYNVISFLPVININQSAILGISSPYDSCKKTDVGFVYDQKVNLILSFDHRVINGKYAAEFLNELKQVLEN